MVDPTNCDGCGAQLRPSAKFCKACGAKVVAERQPESTQAPAALLVGSEAAPYAACPACGEENSETARFCRHCGVAMDGVAAPVSRAAGQYDSDAVDHGVDSEHGLGNGSSFFRRHAVPLLLGVIAMLIVGGVVWINRANWLGNGQSDPSHHPANAETTEPITGQETTMFVVAEANVRDAPTAQSSQPLRKVPRGTALSGVLQFGVDGQSRWFKLSDGSGFVGAVNLASVSPVRLATLLSDRPWSPSGEVQLRSAPTDEAAVVATASAGKQLVLVGLTENGFAEIKLDKGGVGYLRSDGLDLSATENSSANADTMSAVMNKDHFYGEYVGTIADQNITIGFNVDTFTPPLSSAAYASYGNSVTGKSCHSLLQLTSRGGSGTYVFRQTPRAGYASCGMAPSVTMRIAEIGGGGGDDVYRISVDWTDARSRRMVMSGVLTQMGD